jgi:hypothetical protein
VNTADTDPDTVAPGVGDVRVPGTRVSTVNTRLIDATFPSGSVADTVTVYAPSGTTTPASDFPSHAGLSAHVLHVPSEYVENVNP